MEIRSSVDARGLLLKLEKGQRKLAYAVANGINDTAKTIQGETRTAVAEAFTLRGSKGEFLKRQAAIVKPFASAKSGRPFAEIAVGRKERLLLGQFERGGKREPFVGKRVAVPITGNPARPTFSSPVVANLRIKRLGLKPDPRRPGQLIGRQNTYTVKDVGIFQRLGPGPRNSRLLYAFDSDVQLPKRVQFTALWRKRAEALLDDNIDRRIKRELLR